MDVDISDILASVARGQDEDASRGALFADEAQQEQDLQFLTKAWISERVAPELLPYPEELMERVMRRLRQQIEVIEDRTARMDAGTSFGLVVIQTELERFKFLIRSFLRARMSKIDNYALHILSLHQSSPQGTASPLLSQQELQYLTAHAALLERHYSASFLSSFPVKLQRLDDRAGAGGAGMIEGPDLDKAVFVRCLGVPIASGASERAARAPLYDFEDGDNDADMEAGRRKQEAFAGVEVSCGYVARPGHERDREGSAAPSQTQGSRLEGGEKIITMSRGQIWLVRWSAVRQAVERGECELV